MRDKTYTTSHQIIKDHEDYLRQVAIIEDASFNPIILDQPLGKPVGFFAEDINPKITKLYFLFQDASRAVFEGF